MSDKTSYGPGNPHPLSQVKTELIWEGKYDEHGNRREVDVAGCVLPLQKVESIDEPRSHAEGAGQMDLFKKQSKRQDDFRNRLVWGDNKLVMASLLAEFKGKIDLIYIDPPFDVGADFTMDVPIGDTDDVLEKDQSALEMVAYRDMWGKGTDSYLHMLYERFCLMKELLSPTGSFYVHCDWHVNYLIRVALEEVFGFQNFRNEIIWKRKGGSANPSNRLGVVTDSILWFSKSSDIQYEPQYSLESDEVKDYIEERFTNIDDQGRRFMKSPIVSPNPRPNLIYDYRGYSPPRNGWSISRDLMEKWDSEGRLYFPPKESGSRIYRKIYLDEYIGQPVQNLWTDVYVINPVANERLNYDTQKPEALIKRIICSSSKEDDLVGDFFCGSGTTGAVAERLGRRWIMADLGRFAVHTSRKRMIGIQRELYDAGKPYRAFDVYNLGRYERQWWQRERLAGMEEEHRKIVLAFYRAEPLSGAASALLHGRRGPALIHVDGIDSILTLAELKPIVEAAHAAGAKEVHCLAWEFEMELKRNAEALEHEYGVKIRLIRIPREVMEKNRRPGVDHVPFFEMATLTAEPVVKIEGGVRIADVKLSNFLPSLSEVSSKELEALQERAVKSGFDFIDFWAVDFDHKDGQPFKHHWQDYRLRKDRSLKLQSDCGHRYEDNEPHRICVKVIDTFGCDTSILLDALGARGKK